MTTAITVRCTISEAIDLLREVYIPRGAAVMLRGAPGTSKSSRAIALAREFQDADPDFGAAYVNAANMSFPDWQGWPRTGEGMLASTRLPLLFQPVQDKGLRGAFPILNQDSDLTETLDGYSAATLPRYGKGIIIVDEASKGPEECKPSMSMLAEEGRTGEWGVPTDGWCRLFISNRVEDNSQDTDFPATFYNRVVILDIYATIDDVVGYWQEQGMHPDFVTFAKAHPTYVIAENVPVARQPFSTARSWFEAWRDVTAYCHILGVDHATDESGNEVEWPCYLPEVIPVVDANDADDNMQRITRMITAMIAGRVGLATASMFVDFVLANRDMPTYDEIILDPLNAVIPQNAAVQYNVVESLHGNLNLQDIKQIGQYISRSDFPEALASLFCQKVMETHKSAALKSKDFYALINKLGLSARLALYED